MKARRWPQTAAQEGGLTPDQDLFEPAYYLSPALAERTEEKLDRIARRRPEWTSPRGLAPADDALGAEGDGVIQRAAAVEIHPGLRAAHEAASQSNICSDAPWHHFLRCAGRRRRRGGRGGGRRRRTRRRAGGVVGAIRFSGRRWPPPRKWAPFADSICATAASAQPTPVAGGFVQEFAARLQRAAGLEPLRLERRSLGAALFSGGFRARGRCQVVSESGNVTVVLHATVAEARAEGGRLMQVRALAWNEALVIRPGMVVDCSGEATAAALAGAAVEEGGLRSGAGFGF